MNMEGRVFGRFRVTEKIGEGGMAEVYAARHELMGREAAIKLLLPQMSQEHVVKRFFQEAQAAARINHPGIVGVFDVGHAEDGRAYIVMERLSGETLNVRLERVKNLPLNDTLQVVRQLASVMKAAHERGIVHRDLKPDNLFLVEDPMVEGGERIKVLDFGLAKLAADTATVLTAQGMVFGTPGYMAPEQCRDSGKVDERVDLYAIGCIMYRCLCGNPPFVGAALDVLRAHMNTPPVPPRRHDSTLPEAINTLILRLLEKSPDRRIRSCTELLMVLDTGEVPKQDTLVDSQGDRTHDITLVEAGPAGPAFERERSTDVDAEPARLPGVAPRPGTGQADAADSDDAITLLATARSPVADATTATPHRAPPPPALPMRASGSAPAAARASSQDPPLPPGAHVWHGTAGSPAANQAGQQRAARRGRAWFLWGALALVIVASVAVALVAARGGDAPAPQAPPQAPPQARKQPDNETTAGRPDLASVGERFDEHTRRAEAHLAAETWNQALAELERAVELADQHGLADENRTGWARRLQERATHELEHQAVFERLVAAHQAGDAATAAQAFHAISEESVYREKARPLYEQARKRWLDRTQKQIKSLTRRGACADVETLVQTARELFPEESTLEDTARACAKRLARDDSAARHQKHQELFDEARQAFKAGEYGRAYRACESAHKLAPGDHETALLCGMAACRLKNRSAAGSYAAKLPEQRARMLQQLCMKEGVNLGL
jgi:serine/threonine protein kinase/tetratricopeptide (TPR) repeat protein